MKRLIFRSGVLGVLSRGQMVFCEKYFASSESQPDQDNRFLRLRVRFSSEVEGAAIFFLIPLAAARFFANFFYFEEWAW